jgi:hypothetical protein
MFLQLTTTHNSEDKPVFINMDKVVLIKPAISKNTAKLEGSYLFFNFGGSVKWDESIFLFVKETPNEILTWYNK